MKKILQYLKKCCRKTVNCIGISLVLGLALITGFDSHAQTAVQPKVYPVTNGTAFTLTGGALVIPANTTSNIYSAPAPVWRGRGFNLNIGAWAGAPSVSNCTTICQFGTPQKISGTLVTNWSTYGNLTNTFPLNGTNEVFAAFVIGPTQVDNFALVRLLSFYGGATNSVYLDPTNTYISVIP